MSLFFRKNGLDHDTGLCEPKLNCLAHAQCIELDLGSECGGHGVCGKDRIRLPEGASSRFSPPTEAEKRHLDEAKISQGWRLACQCWPEDRGLSLTIDSLGR